MVATLARFCRSPVGGALDMTYLATKRCSKCRVAYPLVAFQANSAARDGCQNWCRDCTNAFQRLRVTPGFKSGLHGSLVVCAWRGCHNLVDWSRAKTEEPTCSFCKIRTSNLRVRFGLTLVAYFAMLDAQGGRCAICRTDTPGGRGDWCVDHDHSFTHVRGLLCGGCNSGLGHFRDSTSSLRAAVRYLESTQPRLLLVKDV